jgi:hypothetical protein
MPEWFDANATDTSAASSAPSATYRIDNIDRIAKGFAGRCLEVVARKLNCECPTANGYANRWPESSCRVFGPAFR